MGGLFFEFFLVLPLVMNILFVHQNFPGQYRHVLKALAMSANMKMVGLGVEALQEPIQLACRQFVMELTAEMLVIFTHGPLKRKPR